jgi:DNA-directed RNA polymerase specialized sigma24 family protein
MEVSGSMEQQCEIRLSNLYKESHSWLLQTAHRITKNKLEAEDLVGELYEYLHLKKNKKLFWGQSYNIGYCQKYLKHRYLNKTKKLNRTVYFETIFDNNTEDVEYDLEKDLAIQKAYDEVMEELKRLETTKNWPQSKIAQYYFFSDKTMEEVAKDIKISKSTTYLAIRKIKEHMKQLLDNPFDETR